MLDSAFLVTLAELVYLSTTTHFLLLTGIERVALRAYVQAHLRFTIGRSSDEDIIATAASYIDLGVFWVYLWFHL